MKHTHTSLPSCRLEKEVDQLSHTAGQCGTDRAVRQRVTMTSATTQIIVVGLVIETNEPWEQRLVRLVLSC